jgi:hypothetical protein
MKFPDIPPGRIAFEIPIYEWHFAIFLSIHCVILALSTLILMFIARNAFKFGIQ